MVPDEVIWTVNWLHYLNYELIDCTSSTCYLVLTRNNLGQTVTSYGWCNRIPCVIDVVPDKAIWTVNWLHYLNYEAISRTSSNCYLVCTRNDLGQTVTSYGWCNGIPRVIPFFRLFSEKFASDCLSYRR